MSGAAFSLPRKGIREWCVHAQHRQPATNRGPVRSDSARAALRRASPEGLSHRYRAAPGRRRPLSADLFRTADPAPRRGARRGHRSVVQLSERHVPGQGRHLRLRLPQERADRTREGAPRDDSRRRGQRGISMRLWHAANLLQSVSAANGHDACRVPSNRSPEVTTRIAHQLNCGREHWPMRRNTT